MKNYFKIICAVAFCFLSNVLFSQQTTYSKVIRADNPDECSVIAFIPVDDGALLVGRNYEGAIIKIDLEGNLVWEKKYGSNLIFNEIIKTSDSLFVIAGETGDGKAICMKINLAGDVVWYKTLSALNGITATNVFGTDNGELILSGTKFETSAPYSKIFLAKLTGNGDLVWTKYYAGGNSNNYIKSIHSFSNGGYLLSGYLDNYPSFEPAGFLINTDTAGNIVWAKKYETPDLQTNPIEDVVVSTDSIISFINISGALALIKTDLDGNISWCKNLGYYGISDFYINSKGLKMHLASNKNLYLVNGSCWGSAFVEFDSLGNLLLKSGLSLATIDVTETKDKGYLIVGNGPLCGLKTDQYLEPQIGIIKTDSLGYAAMCYFEINEVVPFEQALNVSEGNFSVTSAASNFNSSLPNIVSGDFTIEDGCVEQGSIVNEIQTNPSITIFPNPASDNVTIEVANSSSENLKIDLIDMIGKEINSYYATEKTKIDLGEFASGIYIVRCTSEKGIFNSLLAVEK